MVLGYYKYRVKHYFTQAVFLFKLRRKGVQIGKKCTIDKSAIIAKNAFLQDFCIINPDVTLHSGVKIGSNATLSRITVDKNSSIESGVKCTGHGTGKITIGQESYIGINNILDWSDNITIGNYVHIAGPSTGLWTHSSALQCHNGLQLSYKGIEFRPTAPIVIEDFVYIGGNTTIYPGITIGHHSMVAPNSAVTKNVEPYTLVGGCPAKIIKKLI